MVVRGCCLSSSPNSAFEEPRFGGRTHGTGTGEKPLQDIPGKPVDHDLGATFCWISVTLGIVAHDLELLSLDFGLLWRVVACKFWVLGFPGHTCEVQPWSLD